MTEDDFHYTDSAERAGIQGYFRATRTATWGFLMALPLVMLYEVGIIWVNMGRDSQVRISSEGVLKSIFSRVGLTHELVLLGIVLIIGIGIIVWERKKEVTFSTRYPGLIILESIVYAIGLGFLVSGITQLLLSPLMTIQDGESHGMATNIVLSLGAGIYEELLFRVLIVGGAFLALRLVFPNRRRLMYVIAAVIGALSFSAVHHFGAYGDPWALDIFLFRAIFGLVFSVVFLVRGFAVVAWTHALYDVMIFTGLFSLLGKS